MGKPKYETWHLLDDFGGPPGNRNLQISREASNEKKKAMTSKLGIYHYKWCLRLSILLFSCVKTLYYINEVFEIGLMDSCDHHAAILSDWYLHIFTEDE